MSDEPLKIWLVTFWETRGVIECQMTPDEKWIVVDGDCCPRGIWSEGKDWFRTEEEALSEAIELSSEQYLILYDQAERVEALNRKFHDRLEKITEQH